MIGDFGDFGEPTTTTVEKTNITFVTCFIHIYQKEPIEHKTLDWRIQQFECIAKTGVKLCVYGCDVTTPLLTNVLQQYPNVQLLTMDTPYQETPIYKMGNTPGLTFPNVRHETKDTMEYMGLMHAKIEFIYDAIQKNPWNSEVFAWMDFSIAYLFKNKEKTAIRFAELDTHSYIDSFMVVPGCWERIPPNNCSTINNKIHWRFCGTFFMGDKQSLLRFHQLYREHYPTFIKEQKKMVWEVNIWAWLEANTDWNPIWYSSDHNDRIIDIPTTVLSTCILVDK